jgi:hypothetical protein
MHRRRPRPLLERRLEVGRGLEDEALGRANHSLDDRALEQLSGLAGPMPAKAAEPRAIMQRVEKPFRVGAVFDDKVKMAAVGLIRLAVAALPTPTLIDRRSI